MKYHRWKIQNRYPSDPVGVVLKNRGVLNKEDFFKPKYESLPNPNDFPGVKKAVEIILKAKDSKQKIGLFMDYDADGICGGAIIFKTLKDLKINTIYYIPKREEGYGLSKGAVEHFIREKINLLITIDCGIRNNQEIDLAKRSGIKVIVVDHHQLGDLPKADALVHPLIKRNNKLKFKDYSGGGVAFILARELYKNSGHEKWLLDLAAISSIADVVPLKDVNRTIVKYGLLVMKKTRNLGLKKLVEVSGLKLDSLKTYEIGFVIAPRINAAGRISNPKRSFELLVSEDSNFIKKAADELEDLNRERQEILEQTQKEAVEKVIREKLYENKIIVVNQRNWNEGIIGLVASRLVEKFYKPAIVLSRKEKMLKGSARSIPGINITNLISEASSDLLSFGGHSQAAGLSLQVDRFKHFNTRINKIFESQKDLLFERVLTVDAILKINQINLKLVDNLEKMEPFGPSNAKVVFGFENVKIESMQYVGQDKNHCRFNVCFGREKKQCIAFRSIENGFEIKNNDIVSIAFTLKKSYWQNREKIDLIVEDVQKK